MEMNINNDKGMNAILKGVGLVIDEKTKASAFDKTLSGIVTKADYEANIYTVKINGYDYKNIPSTIKVKVNDSVMVMCPQNQLSQMFIYSKIDTTNYIDTTIPTYNNNILHTVHIVDTLTKMILTNNANVMLEFETGGIYMLYGTNYDLSDYGSVVNTSIHLVNTLILTEDEKPVISQIHGTSSLPYTMELNYLNRIKLTNLGSNYETHVAIQKIF